MRRIVHLVMWSGLIVAAAVGAGCHSAWVSSGLLYEEQQNLAKAEQMYKTALYYNDEEAAAHYHLGRVLAYRAVNDHLSEDEMDSVRIKIPLAREHLLRAAELDPEKWKFNPDTDNDADRTPVDDQIDKLWTDLYNFGANALEAQNIEGAENYFDLALMAAPDGKRGFDTMFLRSQLRYNQAIADNENINEDAVRGAVADLETLEVPETDDKAKDLADLVKIKAQMYRTLGEDGKANALYEQLLAENPTDVALLQRVAIARKDDGDFDGAVELQQRAVELASNSTSMTPQEKFTVAYSASLMLRDADRWTECLDMAQRAQQYAISSGEQSRAARTVARAHLELGNFEGTVQAIEPVVQDGGFDPNNIEGWQLYWRGLDGMGRESEALRALERFRALRDGGGDAGR